MKKNLLALLLFIVFISEKTFSQDKPIITSVTGHLVRVTPKLSELNQYPTNLVLRKTRDENGLIGTVKKTGQVKGPSYGSQNAPSNNVVHQNTPNSVTAASATIGANFAGLDYTFVNPSDPNCAVGTNYVIQTINNSSSSYFKIWDKTGTQVQAQTLISAITGIQGAGDPVVLYDQLANRWVLTEFGYTVGLPTTFVNTLIIAVSVSDDPTGSWYVYSFADATYFVDYPKFSVWHNAYYATSNDFNTTGTAYLGSSIYAFDRTKMLAGNTTATVIKSRLTSPIDNYFSMSPVCLEGTTPSSQSGLFCFAQFNEDTADPADDDSLFVFEFTPDFVTPASSVIGTPTKMGTNAIDPVICNATRGQCISQKGSATKVEDLAGRIMYKIIYRNFGSYSAMVLNTTVDSLNAARAGIAWFELRKPTAGNWSIYQQGIYAPSDTLNRWLGAICMDAIGNIGLAYNVSGSNVNPLGTMAYPSIRFTGRNPCDPLGVMTLPEQTIVNGGAANGSTRYGDYNTLSIDPAGNREFWFTAQYNATSTWTTRVASFSLSNCTPLPKVRFNISAFALREADANVVSGCLNYKDYTVNAVIDAAPSAAATLTFSSSGTATSGRDYTVLTPTVILSTGTLTAPVTIRVFDDDAIEGTESFTLSYTINNGGGNASADSYNQTCFLNIIDNDNPPVPPFTLTNPVGGNGTFLSTSGNFNTNYSSRRTQNLFLASELLANGFSAGTITGLGYNFRYNLTPVNPQVFNNLVLSVGSTSSTTLTNFDPAALTSVYSGNYAPPLTNGVNIIPLSTPFVWDGISNIIVQSCYSNPAPSVSDTVSVLGAGVSGGFTPTAYVRQVATGSVCALSATNLSTLRAAISFQINLTKNAVENTIVTSKIESLGPNEDVAFYDAAGKIMARIKNLTAFDYGCTTVSIDRAGTGAVQFYNNTPANYLASKSYRVNPTNNTTTGHYQITLYYTATEVNGWQTATGQLFGSAQMIKVSNGFYIPNVTPSTPHAADLLIIGANPSAYGTTDKTITADFNNTGFSGFGIGVPSAPLPVTLVNLSGHEKNKYGELSWKTTAEFNNKGFELQRSYDGVNFTAITFVNGAGNSSSERDYSYTDKTKLTNLQYYRLKQMDIDGRFNYSNTVSIKSPNANFNLLSATNPFKNTINLLFTQPPSSIIKIELLDISGKTVYTINKIAANSNNVEFTVMDNLSAGNYILKVTTADEQFVKKLVKQ